MKKTEFTEDFLQFWNAYPKRWIRSSDRHVKIGKYEAWQVWKSMSQYEREIALCAVKFERPGEYVRDAHRWLRKKVYLDREESYQRQKEKKQPMGFQKLDVDLTRIGKEVPHIRRDDEPLDFHKVKQMGERMKNN